MGPNNAIAIILPGIVIAVAAVVVFLVDLFSAVSYTHLTLPTNREV